MNLKPLSMMSLCTLCTASTLAAYTAHAAQTMPAGQYSEAPKLSPAAIEKNMEQADAMLKKGEKLVRSAEDDLEDAHARIRKGEALIAKGNEAVRDCRSQYRALVNDAGQATNPDQVADEAKQFDKLADRWEDALDDIEDGEKLIKKGHKESKKAESSLNEGRTLVAAGEKLRSDTARSLDRLVAPATANAATDPYGNARSVR